MEKLGISFGSIFLVIVMIKDPGVMLIEGGGNPQPLAPSDTPVCRISARKESCVP